MWQEDYKKDMEDIKPREEFLQDLASKMHEVEKQNTTVQTIQVKKKRRFYPMVAAAACIVLLVGSVTIYKLSQTTEEDENKLSNMASQEQSNDEQWESLDEEKWFDGVADGQERFDKLITIMEQEKDETIVDIAKRMRTGKYEASDASGSKKEQYTIRMKSGGSTTVIVWDDCKVSCPDVKGHYIIK